MTSQESCRYHINYYTWLQETAYGGQDYTYKTLIQVWRNKPDMMKVYEEVLK